MGLDIPTTMAEITPEWLTAALRESGVLKSATITSAEKEIIGVGVGILGELARITPVYDQEEAGAPKTLVAKIPTADPGGRGVAQMLGFYEKEARFYDELAHRLCAPRSYYSARNPQAIEYVILMEDCCDLRLGDQVAGASKEDAELLLHEIAEQHATWWESPELDALDWIPYGNAPTNLMAQGAAMMAIQPFLEKFGDRLDERQRNVVVAMAPRMNAMQDAFSVRPVTLNHGDLRLDNVFFGNSDGKRALTLIDWQIAVKARGCYDIAYFLSQSIDPVERAANEERWLRDYHATLTERGVTGYSFDQCWDDYRMATLFCVAYPLVAGGQIDLGNERGVELVGEMARRSLTAVTDLDADSLLDRYEERPPFTG